MCWCSSAWKEEGTINRAEPKHAAISAWVSRLVLRHLVFAPEQEHNVGDLPEMRCQGCKVRVLFEDKHQDATPGPGSIPSCPRLMCILSPGQLFLVTTAELYRAENQIKLKQTAFRSLACFSKAYWSISTLQCKLHCRYSLTPFIYTYPYLEKKKPEGV